MQVIINNYLKERIWWYQVDAIYPALRNGICHITGKLNGIRFSRWNGWALLRSSSGRDSEMQH